MSEHYGLIDSWRIGEDNPFDLDEPDVAALDANTFLITYNSQGVRPYYSLQGNIISRDGAQGDDLLIKTNAYDSKIAVRNDGTVALGSMVFNNLSGTDEYDFNLFSYQPNFTLENEYSFQSSIIPYADDHALAVMANDQTASFLTGGSFRNSWAELRIFDVNGAELLRNPLEGFDNLDIRDADIQVLNSGNLFLSLAGRDSATSSYYAAAVEMEPDGDILRVLDSRNISLDGNTRPHFIALSDNEYALLSVTFAYTDPKAHGFFLTIYEADGSPKNDGQKIKIFDDPSVGWEAEYFDGVGLLFAAGDTALLIDTNGAIIGESALQSADNALSLRDHSIDYIGDGEFLIGYEMVVREDRSISSDIILSLVSMPLEEDDFEFNLQTAIQLASAAYTQSSNENSSFNPRPALADQIAAYEALDALPDGSFRFLAESDLAPYGLAEGLFSEGIFTNENAAALVGLAGNTLVLSFRGTNDAPGFPQVVETAAKGLTNAIFEASTKGGNTIAGKGFDKVLEILLEKMLPKQFGQTQQENDSTDFGHWVDMAEHWQLLEPLVRAVDAFVAVRDDVNNVFVTGHSLGGAMANAYMLTHPADEYTTYSSITFASPGLLPQEYSGVDAGRLFDGFIGRTIDDPRVQNFIHDEDAINFPNRLATVILGEQIVLEVRVDGDGFTGPVSQHETELYAASANTIYDAGFDILDFAPFRGLDRVELQLMETPDGISISNEGDEFVLGASNALRLGTLDDDIMRVGGGENQLFAGLAGDDTIFLDVFNELTLSLIDPGEAGVVFGSGDGHDVIIHFNPQNDKVILSNLALQDAEVSNEVAGATLRWNDDSLTFAGYGMNEIQASWFSSFAEDPFAVA